jgi:hydrogenase maturation factor
MSDPELACADEHCITCGDLAVEVRVIAADGARELATGHAETGEATEIDTMLVGPVAPGDRLLVHAGTAIARVGEERAP